MDLSTYTLTSSAVDLALRIARHTPGCIVRETGGPISNLDDLNEIVPTGAVPLTIEPYLRQQGKSPEKPIQRIDILMAFASEVHLGHHDNDSLSHLLLPVIITDEDEDGGYRAIYTANHRVILIPRLENVSDREINWYFQPKAAIHVGKIICLLLESEYQQLHLSQSQSSKIQGLCRQTSSLP